MGPLDSFLIGNIFNFKCHMIIFHDFFTSTLLLIVNSKASHEYSAMFTKGSILDV